VPIPGDVIVPNAGTPLTVGMVVFTSIVGALGAAVAFAIVGRFARRPVRKFVVLAAVVLVLSFVTALSIPGAPLSMILAMELMHVVAAAVIVGVLVTLGRGR
jgi:lysylphosphatidylglycerol synthetase-like protein (DUF2156 family)